MPWATAKMAQPINPLSNWLSLRAIPGLVTLRPGDANEVVEAYRYIMQLRHKPAGAGPVPPTPADAGSEQVCARLRVSRGALMCWPMRPAGTRSHPHRHRAAK